MIPVKMAAIGYDDVNFFGKEWYSELINLAIDSYTDGKDFKIIQACEKFWVFIPVRMDGGFYGVFFDTDDVIAFESTGSAGHFFNNTRAVYLEERVSE